ncbi:MAG: hypothetical protein QOJ12_2153 [Thermoleophilales bacterium]|nr:hypothetical protein [Thermoleophilales bacterium]
MTAGGEPDAAGAELRVAYEARSRQLLEARAALAESDERLAALTAERDVLQTELDTLRGSKLVRWSAPLRRAVYHLRARRR